MATRKAGIAAELSANNDKWKQGLAQARADAMKFASSLPSIKGQPGFMTGMAGGAQAAGLKFTELAGKVAVAGAVIKGLGLVGDKLQEAAQVEMDFEGAVAGLAAVSDGSETLKAQLAALMDLGEKPGLGFQQVINGSRDLQSVGLNAKEARSAMEQFGNAVALVGGGKDEFAEVMISLRQIMSTGSVDMENLKEISTRIPQFLQISASLDKTNAGKFVQGAVTALGQLPRAAVTASEAVSNLDDAWKKTMLNTSGGRAVDVIKNASAAAQAGMKGDTAGAAKFTAAAAQAVITPKDLVSQYELTPEQIKARANAKAAADKAAIDAANVKFAKGQKILDLEAELEAAKLSGDRQQINAAEERLAIAEDLADVMKDYKLTEEQALTIIKAQVQNEQQRAEMIRTAEKIKDNAQRKREGEKAAGSTAEDIAIQEARARGQNKKADRMERNRSEQQLRAQLIEQGVNPQQAAALAQRKAQADEDAEYFQRTGRRKTRGAVSDNNPIRLGRGFGKEAGFSAPSKLDTANQSGGPGNQTGMTEKLLTEIRDQLLANRPTIAQRTAPRS
jgi:tape measure domain-containing protein